MTLAKNCSTSAKAGEVRLTLPLRHAGPTDLTLKYEIAGRGPRLLIVGGGISAGRHVIGGEEFPEPGWWQAQASTFDLDRYSLLAIDWIGADGALDLPIEASDQADAIAALLEHLGLERAHGFVGASYGGMVALHLAARHPDRCRAILVISAAGSSHPFASACRALQRRALALGKSIGDRAAGIGLARAMAMLTYRTPAEFAERFARQPRIEQGRVRVAAEDYLDFHGRRHVERMNAIAYRRLSESIDLHRVEPAAIAVPATLVAVDSDALVPAADIEAFASAIPSARFTAIPSIFGHDAFLKEEGAIAAIINDFFDSQEPSQ